MKVCPNCKVQLSLASFGTSKRDGIQSWCRTCRRKSDSPAKSKIRVDKYRHTLRGILVSRFSDIKKRCNDPEHQHYERYGGRGIQCLFKSSDEFATYVLTVLQADPTGLDVDRIDNAGDYEPGNIRVVTHIINMNNRGCSK